MTTATQTQTATDFADAAPDFAQAVAACWNWSHNFADFRPMRMLLDLVGYSADELGAPLHDWGSGSSLGAYDLSVLADAVAAWADRPADCYEWTHRLLTLEQGGE